MLQTINICITVNVFVIAVILFIKKSGDIKSNRLLAVILLSNIIINVWNVLLLNKYPIYQYLVYWEYIAAFAAGPTIYLYVLHTIGRKISFNYKTAIQYIFMPLAFVFYLIFIFKSEPEKLQFLEKVYKYESVEFQVLDLLFYLQFTFYLVFCLVIVYKNKNRGKEFFSTPEKAKFDWLFAFLLTLLIMDLSAIPIATFMAPTMAQFVPILSSLIYLTLVYKAFTQPFVFSEYTEFEKMETKKNVPVKEEVPVMNIDFADSLIQKVTQYMEQEKPYLNKDLTIKMLADGMNIPTSQLSQIINQNFKKNFFDFINSYRVEDAKKKLLDPQYAHLKIESLGEASGFNSRASFFSTFRKHSQMTPAEFRKQTLVK